MMKNPFNTLIIVFCLSIGHTYGQGSNIQQTVNDIIGRQQEVASEMIQKLTDSQSVSIDSLFIAFIARHDTLNTFYPDLNDGYYQAFSGTTDVVDSLLAASGYFFNELERSFNHASMVYFDIFNETAEEITYEAFTENLNWYHFYMERLKESVDELASEISGTPPSYLKVVDAQISRVPDTVNIYQASITLVNIGEDLTEETNAKLVLFGVGEIILEKDTLATGPLAKEDTITLQSDLTNAFRGNESSISLTYVNTNGQNAKIVFERETGFRRQSRLLSAGWNLVSFYVEPDYPEISTFWDPVKEKIIRVKDDSKSYVPTLPPSSNTLTVLENGKGYWVNLSEAVKFSADGTIIESGTLEIPLSAGWNLIAFPKEDPQSIAEALASIINRTEQIKNTSKSYNPTLPDFLNTLTELRPGEGYWIKVNGDCVLKF